MSDEEMRAALKTIWERSRTTILNRVTVVEEASRALMRKELSSEARSQRIRVISPRSLCASFLAS